MIFQQAIRTVVLPSDKKAAGAAAVYKTSAVLIGLLTCATYAAPAHAYLDPGTGSILLQGLLAAMAAAAAVCGVFWDRVKSFFASIFPSKKAPPAPEEPDRDR